MKARMFAITLVIIVSGYRVRGQDQPTLWPADLPVYDHIVIVVEENKDYDEVIGSGQAPYIDDVLRVEGANLIQMFAEEHNSQGNYFWLFSGSNQNVGFVDVIPNKHNNPAYPFMAKNLGEQLLKKGLSFKGYAEDLPGIGSTVITAGHYARKHVPWISFGNLPKGSTVATSVNLTFDQFPSNYAKLPTVSIVVPNLLNDMHDGGFPMDVLKGDKWLKENLGRYYKWAKAHNSLLIVTFDESENRSWEVGLTDPADSIIERRNRIPTILAGAHIKVGEYDRPATHVNLLHTIEAMYGLERIGDQQKYAKQSGISADFILTDMFAHVNRKPSNSAKGKTE
jgi:acid phosphatase